MRQDSVFGYIASRSGQPKNVATEALNYVLNGSVVAKRAFLGYVAQTINWSGLRISVNFTLRRIQG